MRAGGAVGGLIAVARVGRVGGGHGVVDDGRPAVGRRCGEGHRGLAVAGRGGTDGRRPGHRDGTTAAEAVEGSPVPWKLVEVTVKV